MMKRNNSFNLCKKEKIKVLIFLAIMLTPMLHLLAIQQPQTLTAHAEISPKAKMAGTVWMSVPTNPYQNPNCDPSYWIPILKEFEVDGVFVGFGGEWFWWKDVEGARNILRQYKEAGFLVITQWDHHGGYGPENNPWVQNYASKHPEKQMVAIYRFFLDTSSIDKPHKYYPNGTLVVAVGPAFGKTSVYKYYPASGFTWLYNDTHYALEGKPVDPPDFESGPECRLRYGVDYELIVNSTGEYLKIYKTKLGKDIVYNLYLLEFKEGFLSFFFEDTLEVWLRSWELFLGNFSDLLDGVWQNNGGVHSLGAHPELIRHVEEKYGIDFNFDNWCHTWWLPVWNTTSKAQYLLEYERYLMLKEYARRKSELTHKYGLVWGVSSSDLKKGVRYMVEYLDFIEVNEGPKEAGAVHMYASSWADTGWSPSNSSLGTMTTCLIFSDRTVEDFLAYKRSATYGLAFNPEGAMLLWWTQTNGYNIKAEWREAIKEVDEYWHALFSGVKKLLGINPKRHVIGGIYYLSYTNRYAQRAWVNLGQVYMYPLDLHYLTYIGVPKDGLGIYIGQTYNGVPGSSTPFINLDAEPAFKALKLWVSKGGRLAIAHSFYKHVKAGKASNADKIAEIVRELVNAEEDVEPKSREEWPILENKHPLTIGLEGAMGFYYGGAWAKSWEYRAGENEHIVLQYCPPLERNISLLHERHYGEGLVLAVAKTMEPFYEPSGGDVSAYEEYWSRIVLYLSRKLDAPRVHNAGRTFVWKKHNVYYVMMVDSWGMGPREVPLILYNMPKSVIVEISTWNIIENGTKVKLGKYEAKFYAIITGDTPSLVWSESKAVDFQFTGGNFYYHVIPEEGGSLTVVYWPDEGIFWQRLDTGQIIERVSSLEELENKENAVFYNSTTGLWFVKITHSEPIGVYGFTSQSFFLSVNSEPLDNIEITYKGDLEGTALTPFHLSSATPFTVELSAPEEVERDGVSYVLKGWKLDNLLYEENPITVEVTDENPYRSVSAVYKELITLSLKVLSGPIDGITVNYTGSFEGVGTTPFELSGAVPFTVKLSAPEEVERDGVSYVLKGWKIDGVLVEEPTVTVEVSESDRVAEAIYESSQNGDIGYPITIHSVETLDESEEECSEFELYEMVLIRVVINCSSSLTEPLKYIGIVKVKNPKGEMVAYGSLMAEIEPGEIQEFTVGVVPIGDVTGTYTAIVYIWSDWPSKGGTPLSDPAQISFEVVAGED